MRRNGREADDLGMPRAGIPFPHRRIRSHATPTNIGSDRTGDFRNRPRRKGFCWPAGRAIGASGRDPQTETGFATMQIAYSTHSFKRHVLDAAGSDDIEELDADERP
jgi:hypothetical protein